MNFTNPSFFIFLIIVLLLCKITKKEYSYLILLVSSYVFYGFYNIKLLILLVLCTLISYFCALKMEGSDLKRKKTYLCISSVFCLGLLFVFKYFNFTLQSIYGFINIFGANYRFNSLNIILPMGISFYVFQTLSYVIDVYHERFEAEHNIGYYALFVSFFPQLVAGPIERPGDLIPQLRNRCESEGLQKDGFMYFIKGFSKKVLIADFIGKYVDTAYGNISSMTGGALIIATFLFSIQIYCDFSGYSDIAIGCANFLGIRLTQNFNSPYKAVSIRDFWKRWHITLTKWFTDYVYIPLGGNKKGKLKTYLNVLLTFLLSGLWHGANFTYIFWGLLNGIFLIIERIISDLSPKKRSKGLFYVFLTFLFISFTWIFFRSQTINDAFLAVAKIFTSTSLADFSFASLYSSLGISAIEVIICLLLCILLHFIDNLEIIRTYNDVVIYLMLIISIILCKSIVLNECGETHFIYFTF